MFQKLLIAVCVFFLVVQIGMAGTIKPVTIKKRVYYPLKSLAANYKMQYEAKGSTITLTLPDKRKFVLTVDKVETTLFGTVVHLAYPIAKDSKGSCCISKSDYDTLIYPILHPDKLTRRSTRTIILDAGHGGKDNGAIRGGIKEKNLTLVIVKRVAAMLKKRGYRVLMTRSADKGLELSDRTDFANRNKCDLFVSVHFNAHSSDKISGIEVYVSNPANVPSFMGKTGVTAPSNRYDKENSLLGYLMQRRFISATKATDRGLKRVQHYVTRNVSCPAVLVELGFISNPNDCGKFSQSAYLDKLSGAICDGIQDFDKAMKPVKK